jgi:hypothetical protein
VPFNWVDAGTEFAESFDFIIKYVFSGFVNMPEISDCLFSAVCIIRSSPTTGGIVEFDNPMKESPTELILVQLCIHRCFIKDFGTEKTVRLPPYFSFRWFLLFC